jgi:hypothetical protein
MNTEQWLTQDEVDEFVASLDRNKDGHISYKEVEEQFDAAYIALLPNAKGHHMGENADLEKHDEEKEATASRHAFVRTMIGTKSDTIPVADLKETIQKWRIPSPFTDERGHCGESMVQSISLWPLSSLYSLV